MMAEEYNKDDAWLLLKKGDEAALEALYTRHYIGLINFGVKLTGDREFSNECITQVLIELWDKRDRLPYPENVRSYLLSCLKHKIIAGIKSERARGARLHSLQALMEREELPYEEYLIRIQSDRALKEQLKTALAKLTVRQRELLRMKFFEDLDYDEIALQGGITKRTAYNIIHDALKALKAALHEDQNSTSFLYYTILLAILFIFLDFS